jgi:hypothetical protein
METLARFHFGRRPIDETLDIQEMVSELLNYPHGDFPQLKKEEVDHPEHYQGKTMEVSDIIEDFDLNFNLGNVLKYVLRAGKKDSDTYTVDLQKAITYLQREIDRD